MFLSLQKAHHCRTIICIEAAQDDGWWMLDGVRRLVELENEGKFGLMVILSGHPSLNELLNKPPLDAICAQAGQGITLAPPTLTETTEYLRRPSTMHQSDAEAGSVEAKGSSSPRGRLIVRMNDEVIQERILDRESILIGRDELCDIRLMSSPVSRRHALVVNSSTGIDLVDLGSRNGTFVDGRQIGQYTLQDRDVIVVGYCRIQYVAGDDR